MKTISIRFNDHLANWIMGNCQKNKITISEFIRDLLYEKMQQGSITLGDTKSTRTGAINKNSKSRMGYIVFTAKLIEKLVLTTQPQGEILRNIAFEETENLLDQLHVNGKGQRFCIRLEEPLFIWLNSEATRLQLKIIPLVRKVIKNVFIQSNSTVDAELSNPDLQKIAMEHQITACKLLEKLIHKTMDDAQIIIEEVRFKTENLLSKLFPEHTTFN
jgi:predicted DNA-binding ribbon-helix-helix protein